MRTTCCTHNANYSLTLCLFLSRVTIRTIQRCIFLRANLHLIELLSLLASVELYFLVAWTKLGGWFRGVGPKPFNHSILNCVRGKHYNNAYVFTNALSLHSFCNARNFHPRLRTENEIGGANGFVQVLLNIQQKYIKLTVFYCWAYQTTILNCHTKSQLNKVSCPTAC